MNNIEQRSALDKGKTTCDRDILLSIVNLAAKEISGVARLAPVHRAVIGRGSGKTGVQGVKIKIDSEGQLTVDVFIEIVNGFKVPEVAFRIQENIKNAISSMMEMKLAEVNVHVLKVNMSGHVDTGN